ncbi:MAG: DUF3383 family protein [Myxococcales bacterium]|nr:DUF3383 family protein [Myxococcales bacterium]
MSLDSIVRISISMKNVQMTQAGFGVPLIIAETDWPERVRVLSTIADFPVIKTAEQGSNKKETKLSDKKLTTDSALYKIAKLVLMQNPRVSKVKIGKREEKESVEEAFNNIVKEDSDFYGVLIVKKSNEDIQSLARAIEGKRFLAGIDVDAQDEAILNKLKDKGFRNLFAIYAPEKEQFLAAAWISKMLSLAPGSASWAFKSLDGVSPCKLDSDTTEKLKKANINRYIGVSGQGITLDGRVVKGEYIDVIHGIDWLQVRIQERLLRLLVLNPKIPYTLKGIDLVRCEILAQLKEGIYCGLLAADPEPHVSIPDLDIIDAQKRERRILPDVRFGARLASAIHEIEIQGNVSV